MLVITPECRVCGSRGELDGVDPLGFIRWSELGEPVQTALPQLDDDQRELLITGTHAHCWQVLFGEDD